MCEPSSTSYQIQSQQIIDNSFNSQYDELKNSSTPLKVNDFTKLFESSKSFDEHSASVTLLNKKINKNLKNRKNSYRITRLFLCIGDCLRLTQVGRSKRLLRNEVTQLFARAVGLNNSPQNLTTLQNTLENISDRYSYSLVLKNKDYKDLINQPKIALILHKNGVKPINFLELIKNSPDDLLKYIKNDAGEFDFNNLMGVRTKRSGLEMSLFHALVLEHKFDLIGNILGEFQKDNKINSLSFCLIQILPLGKNERLNGLMEVTSQLGVKWEEKQYTEGFKVRVINTNELSDELKKGLALLMNYHNQHTHGNEMAYPYYSFSEPTEAALNMRNINKQDFLGQLLTI